MNTGLNQGSAKIYQFPVGGRSALAGGREEPKATTDFASARLADIAIGGAWYHDAAIEDSKPARER